MRTRLPFLSRRRGLTTLLGMPGLEACFDAQIPSSVNPDSVGRVAQWNDLTGKARHLTQGTAASQPIYLPWSGQNYGYLPGAAGNYFSTPDSAAVSVTGDIDIRVYLAAQSWTPPGLSTVIGKFGTNNNTFLFDIEASGTFRFVYSTGGVVPTGVHSSTVATGFAANAARWMRVTRSSSTGSVIFYTSTDGVTYNQLGTTIAGATGAMFDGTSPVELGSTLFGTVQNLAGSIYYAEIRNGINGTVVAAFDPSRATDGASSFVAATGETWTVNSTDGKPAQIVGRAAVMFDGADDFMQATISLPQPTTLYFVLNPISWSATDAVCDGIPTDTMHILQQTSSPNLDLIAGFPLFSAQLALPLRTTSVLPVVFNAANSLMSRNRLAATTGATGTAGATGLTLAAYANGAARFGNFKYSAVAVFSAAHDSRTRARVIDHLINRHRIAA